MTFNFLQRIMQNFHFCVVCLLFSPYSGTKSGISVYVKLSESAAVCVRLSAR